MESSTMHLYDGDIAGIKKLLDGLRAGKLAEKAPWKCTDQESLVLRSDMAYELGGGTNAAVSGLAFTLDPSLVKESGVWLAGPDLQEISQDVSYARITLLGLENPGELSSQQWYALLRKMDYTRYHLYPEGYMMRISAVKEREPVRISRSGLQAGMDFAGIGAAFREQYQKHPHVRAVQTYFITLPEADYGEIGRLAHHMEQITESLNQVFKGLNMDCSTCSQKQLCDEIDGLKELHLKSL